MDKVLVSGRKEFDPGGLNISLFPEAWPLRVESSDSDLLPRHFSLAIIGLKDSIEPDNIGGLRED